MIPIIPISGGLMGKAPDCRAEGRGFDPWIRPLTEKHSLFTQQ